MILKTLHVHAWPMRPSYFFLLLHARNHKKNKSRNDDDGVIISCFIKWAGGEKQVKKKFLTKSTSKMEISLSFGFCGAPIAWGLHSWKT